MTDLQEMALRAVAETPAPSAGSHNLRAVALLRNLDGKKRLLREYIDAVKWAMAQPTTTLTRAAKEKLVAGLASMLAAMSENRAYSDAGMPGTKPDEVSYFQRRQRWIQAAIVRVAMAKTID